MITSRVRTVRDIAVKEDSLRDFVHSLDVLAKLQRETLRAYPVLWALLEQLCARAIEDWSRERSKGDK